MKSLLLFALFSDFRELPLVVLPGPALLGFPPGVVLNPLQFLLPRIHELVVALADVLLLVIGYQNLTCTIAAEKTSILSPLASKTAFYWLLATPLNVQKQIPVLKQDKTVMLLPSMIANHRTLSITIK